MQMQGDAERNDEGYSESSTWGNSRRIASPISFMERRQKNEQFFFPRPINIFATILLLRLPSPPVLPHLPPFFPLFLPISFPPYCDMSNPVETMRNDGRQVSSSEYTNVSIPDDENASGILHTFAGSHEGRKTTVDGKEKCIAYRLWKWNYINFQGSCFIL